MILLIGPILTIGIGAALAVRAFGDWRLARVRLAAARAYDDLEREMSFTAPEVDDDVIVLRPIGTPPVQSTDTFRPPAGIRRVTYC